MQRPEATQRIRTTGKSIRISRLVALACAAMAAVSISSVLIFYSVSGMS